MISSEDLFLAVSQDKRERNLPLAMDRLTAFLHEQPTVAWAWNERASILSELGHPFDAVLNYDRAVALAPKTASFYNNRGVALLNMNRFDQAIADFERAVHHDPKMAVSYNSMGVAYRKKGDTRKAIEKYRKAVSVKPDYADAHLGLSFSLLETEQYEEGWNEMEWRWKTGQLPARGLPYIEWDGTPCNDKMAGLLVYAEQGFGDALQFMRYLPAVRQLWKGKVFFEVKRPLLRLTEKSIDCDGVVALGDQIHSDVTHCVALMTLPRFIKGIPNTNPYLCWDTDLASIWAQRAKALPPGRLVGLCWAGQNRAHDQILDALDKSRSLNLSDFSPLAQVRGVSWVSLQCGKPADQVCKPPAGMHILDPQEDLFDFYDTAALIGTLDLVITVDTAVAHLAGALGKPTWMLSRFDGCWRWLGNRTDSPWYPTLRQFRQKSLGNWGPVIAEVKGHLEYSTPQRVAA